MIKNNKNFHFFEYFASFGDKKLTLSTLGIIKVNKFEISS